MLNIADHLFESLKSRAQNLPVTAVEVSVISVARLKPGILLSFSLKHGIILNVQVVALHLAVLMEVHAKLLIVY